MEMSKPVGWSSMMIYLEAMPGEPDVWSTSDSAVVRSPFVFDKKLVVSIWWLV